MLSYIQRGVVEVWKDNLLDKLSKRESETEMAEELFSKMRNKLGKQQKKREKLSS